MNVSITDEATMSRTRAEGGATVVRKEAITNMPAEAGEANPERVRVTNALR